MQVGMALVSILGVYENTPNKTLQRTAVAAAEFGRYALAY